MATTNTFEMNGKAYEADRETATLLRRAVSAAKTTGDYSAVTCLMVIGLKTRAILES